MSCVRVSGSGYFALSMLYWLRKVSPRLRVYLEGSSLSGVSTPRSLRMLALGVEGREASIESLLRLFYPDLAWKSSPLEPCYEVIVEEPSVNGVKLSSIYAENHRLAPGIVTPPCAQAAQLAIYARRLGAPLRLRGRVAEVFEEDALSLLNKLLGNYGLLTEEPGSVDRSACLPGSLVFRTPTGEEERFSVYPFFDENIEQYAAYLAFKIAGYEDLVGRPEPLVLLEDPGNNVLLYVYKSPGDTSVKTQVEGGWCRVSASSDSRRVAGIQCCAAPRVDLFEKVFSLLLDGRDICSFMPFLAATRSPLLRESRYLRSLLALFFKVCL